MGGFVYQTPSPEDAPFVSFLPFSCSLRYISVAFSTIIRLTGWSVLCFAFTAVFGHTGCRFLALVSVGLPPVCWCFSLGHVTSLLRHHTHSWRHSTCTRIHSKKLRLSFKHLVLVLVFFFYLVIRFKSYALLFLPVNSIIYNTRFSASHVCTVYVYRFTAMFWLPNIRFFFYFSGICRIEVLFFISIFPCIFRIPIIILKFCLCW